MTETVAVITAEKATDLKDLYPDLEIVQDCAGNNYIHIEEADALVGSGGFAEMVFNDEFFIGSPRPRKRS